MIGGQVADLEAEGKPVDKDMLEYIHRAKTGALIRASIVAGAIAGGAESPGPQPPDEFRRKYRLGLSSRRRHSRRRRILRRPGQNRGQRPAQNKATYPALHGLEVSHDIAADLEAKALKELEFYGPAPTT